MSMGKDETITRIGGGLRERLEAQQTPQPPRVNELMRKLELRLADNPTRLTLIQKRS